VGRILCIDYGAKRCGLAWTDPLKLIATGLESLATGDLKERLRQLVENEEIEQVLLGYPTRLDGSDTHVTAAVRQFKSWLETEFPAMTVTFWDERFTSRLAVDAMIEGGLSRKKRRNKGLIDQLSATLMLQEYLNQAD
jgi:putative Holliday junction resolvase